jgi:hypothetical protein
MVTSTHTWVETRGCFFDASVDHTEARKTMSRCGAESQVVGLMIGKAVAFSPAMRENDDRRSNLPTRLVTSPSTTARRTTSNR